MFSYGAVLFGLAVKSGSVAVCLGRVRLGKAGSGKAGRGLGTAVMSRFGWVA